MTLFDFAEQKPRMQAIRRYLYAPKGKKKAREIEARRETLKALRNEIAATKPAA